MALFSERNGYTKPSDVIIREKITPEIENAICSCFYDLRINNSSFYETAELHVWRYFLNKNANDFERQDPFSQFNDKYEDRAIIPYIKDKNIPWFRKLDLVEFVVKYYFDTKSNSSLKDLVSKLNTEFSRFNFSYRIIKESVTEITSNEEIAAIEQALKSENSSVKFHLNKALDLLSLRPEGDYRNSIKESISAVEAFNRTITGGSDFNLKKMEKKGIVLPPVLKKAFDTLYGYTCDPDIGVRHSLIDVDSDYIPNSEEAIFMLVSCSAFINYLEKKKSN